MANGKKSPLRRSIFSRDGWRCLCCGSPDNLTLDHIKPRSQGGTRARSNLQTLCLACNMTKGAREINYRHRVHSAAGGPNGRAVAVEPAPPVRNETISQAAPVVRLPRPPLTRGKIWLRTEEAPPLVGRIVTAYRPEDGMMLRVYRHVFPRAPERAPLWVTAAIPHRTFELWQLPFWSATPD